MCGGACHSNRPDNKLANVADGFHSADPLLLTLLALNLFALLCCPAAMVLNSDHYRVAANFTFKQHRASLHGCFFNGGATMGADNVHSWVSESQGTQDLHAMLPSAFHCIHFMVCFHLPPLLCQSAGPIALTLWLIIDD
jgi:hypothetical protein